MRGTPLAAVGAASALVVSATFVSATTFVLSDAPVPPPPAPVVTPPQRTPDETPAVALPDPASVPDPHLASGIVVRVAARPTPRLDAVPTRAVRAYQRAEAVMAAAAADCGLRWTLVAAVGQVVSAHGTAAGGALDARGVMKPRYAGKPLRRRDGARVPDTDAGGHDHDGRYDRPVGPMQLSPATWAVVGVDADGNGRRNPYDIDDAALGVAVLLCAGGRDLHTPAGLRRGVGQVNHAARFVAWVLAVARVYERELETAGDAVVTTAALPARLEARPVAVAAPTEQETRAALHDYPGAAPVPTDPVTWSPTTSPTPPWTEPATADPTTDPTTDPTSWPSDTAWPSATPTETATETATPTTTDSSTASPTPTDVPPSESPATNQPTPTYADSSSSP